MESIRLCPTLEIKCIQIKNEPGHDISNNVACAPSKGSDQPAYAQSDQRLC